MFLATNNPFVLPLLLAAMLLFFGGILATNVIIIVRLRRGRVMAGTLLFVFPSMAILLPILARDLGGASGMPLYLLGSLGMGLWVGTAILANRLIVANRAGQLTVPVFPRGSHDEF